MIEASTYTIFYFFVVPFLEFLILVVPSVFFLFRISKRLPFLVLSYVGLLMVLGLELYLTIEVTQGEIKPWHSVKIFISALVFLLIFRNPLFPVKD